MGDHMEKAVANPDAARARLRLVLDERVETALRYLDETERRQVVQRLEILETHSPENIAKTFRRLQSAPGSPPMYLIRLTNRLRAIFRYVGQDTVFVEDLVSHDILTRHFREGRELKTFSLHQLDIAKCQQELTELKNLLDSQPEFDERNDVLPFFKRRSNLSSFISTYVNDIANPDRLAFELDLFGDFACDLAVGDSSSQTYLLIEFEDVKKNSLFKDGKKYAPDWSQRLEHGFSQIIDWFWKLDDFEETDDYEHKFGARKATFHGLVIIGRGENLSSREKKRLKWRQDHVVVDSKKVSIVSFDQLVKDLEFRLTRYSEAAKADNS